MDHGDMPMPMPTPMTPDPMYTNSTDTGMAMMHMSFFWGRDVTVLFQGWPNERLGMYILALIFVFFLAVAVEVLSSYPAGTKARAGTGASPVVTSLIHAAVYAVRMALAYMVMLSVMSFNLGIFVVAVVGHAAGYFLAKLRNTSTLNTSDGYPKV